MPTSPSPHSIGTSPIGISVKGLSVQFNDQPPVLRGLDLEISNGEIVALVGASGCGKSTLLRSIAGLMPPGSGRIELTGAAAGKMSYVFQDATLLPWRTVIENVRLPLELRGSVQLDQRERQGSVKDRVESALRSVELDSGSWLKFPRELSGGMRMRASIARALVTDPEVLLLDEPFAALDDLLRSKMNELVLRLWQTRRRTVLFVTHNIAEAAYMSHRIAVFGQGRIAQVLENRLPWPRTSEQRAGVNFAEQYGVISQALAKAAN